MTGHLNSPSSSTPYSTPSSASHTSLPSADLIPPSDDQNDRTLFEIRRTSDHGVGLFAAYRITAGTCVFSEEALISLPRDLEEDPDAIEAAFWSLSKRDRKQYLKLFDAQKSRMSQKVSIYYSNCYSTDDFAQRPSTSPAPEMTDPQHDGGSCIGVISSRINHSCLPNLSFSYSPPSLTHAKGEMRFYAIKNIARGKELLSSYDKSIVDSRSKRRQKHMLHYGFTCDCEACVPKSNFWEKSDERRREMGICLKIASAAERDYEHARKRGTDTSVEIDKALEALTRLVDLLTKESLTHKPLANVYRSLAKWSSRKGDPSNGRSWKQMEFEVCVRCFGKASGRVQGIRLELLALHKAG